MKTPVLFIVILLLSVPAPGQNLTLKKLLKLREMNVPEMDEKLSRKGWILQSDSKPTDDFMGKAVWAYEPTAAGDGAAAWCVLYYNTSSPSRILYNVNPDKPIQKIQKKLRRRKMRPISEGNSLESLDQLKYYADYPDTRYVYRLLTYNQFGYSGIKIFEKADYEKAKP